MLLRYHLRTLFSGWHLAALALLAAASLLWPAGDMEERFVLAWILKRSELLGPPILMALVSTILTVRGQVDERWGAAPPGFPGLFLQRWLLTLGYFALALAIWLSIAGMRTGGPFPFGRTLASTLITGALFSLIVPLGHARTGSPVAGWAAGLALYFVTVTIAQFWCPYDSTYQLWLPFAGVSDATAPALAISKCAYGLATLGLLWANWRGLAYPERLV